MLIREPTSISICPYVPHENEAEVYALWTNVFTHTWPLSATQFHHITTDLPEKITPYYFVARKYNRIVGFIGILIEETAEVLCVFISPREQRKGIGSELLGVAISAVKKRGIKKICLGSGTRSYLWPGIPTNLPNAIQFFQRHSFHCNALSTDMMLDLHEFKPQKITLQQADGILLSNPKPQEIWKVLDFERKNFPQWSNYYQSAFQENRQNDILVAKAADDTVVGAVLVEKKPFVWKNLLKGETGSLGALGVVKKMRGEGIGSALAVRGTQLLKERGIRTAYLGWTDIPDWYRRLGYRVWREYKMGSRDL